ncbi:MAG TPA: DUF4286 family protein [Chitinophagaceae bacterium]|nr:DUF4286 family protein [Chitinophagaceae bacterium]
MFIYNITTKVENDIAGEWLRWQKEIHIPEILATGLFSDHRVFKLMEQDESEGQTFVVQFYAVELSHYKEYLEKHAPALRNKAFQQWRNKFISFRTLLSGV